MDNLVIILMFIIDLLPTSPVSKMLEKIELGGIVGFLNFFIPFDFCAFALEIWLVCVSAYYVYQHIIKKFI